MSADISVNPNVKVITGRKTTLISFHDRLVYACAECGHTKHIQYLVPPHLNVTIYDQSDYCVCGQAMSNRHLLEEVYVAMGTCKTVEEARLLILSLKSASA